MKRMIVVVVMAVLGVSALAASTASQMVVSVGAGAVAGAAKVASAAPVAQVDSKYNEKFTVRSAYNPATGGCFMTLENGRASYDVVNTGFKRCHLFYPGTVLSGRFHKYGRQGIELVSTDEKGKPKVYWCVTQGVTYLSQQ